MNFVGKDEVTALNEILERFFSSRPIKERFKFIGDYDFYGCEKWIQIEILKHLHDTDNIHNDEIVKEECYEFDKRTKDCKNLQFIDLSFRLKNKKYYIALELKHKSSLALSEVNKDLLKTKKIKPSQKDSFRQLFCLLIHPFQDEDTIRKRVASKQDFNGNFEFTIKIPTTNLSCTVFSSKIWR